MGRRSALARQPIRSPISICARAGAQGQPRARVPHLVASRPPRPYHFPARIQSFQTVAAPFPGDSVLPSRSSRAAIPATETPRFKRSTITLGDLRRDGGVGTNIERLRNSGKKFVERLGSYIQIGKAAPLVTRACRGSTSFWRRPRRSRWRPFSLCCGLPWPIRQRVTG